MKRAASKKKVLKNSVGNPSGPGVFPDCIEEIAWVISAWVVGASSFLIRSGGIEGLGSELRKVLIIDSSPSNSEE